MIRSPPIFLTNDPRVFGQVSDDQGVTKLEASVDGGASQDITSSLVGSDYTFDPGALASGPHQLIIRVTDTGGQTADAVVDLVVNHLPVADAGENRTITEGSTVDFDASVSSDPDGPIFSYLWTFDDATTSSGVTAQRHYIEDGMFPVTLSVTDTAGSVDDNVIHVTVKNLPVNIDPISDITIGEGKTVALSGSFADPGILDTHVGVVDWGDGSPVGPATIAELSGTGTVSGSHIYADDGNYAVTITVTDDEGAEASTSFAIAVANDAPTVVTSPANQSLQYSDSITDVIIQASDVAADTVSIATEYRINGGSFTSGLPQGLQLSGSGGTGSGTWTISSVADVAPGTYTIRATVSDEDAGQTVSEVAVEVLAGRRRGRLFRHPLCLDVHARLRPRDSASAGDDSRHLGRRRRRRSAG